jgi:hypothetical protein
VVERCHASVELGPDLDATTERTVMVTIADDLGRTLSVSGGQAPVPRPHTAASLLRVAHSLHRLGCVLGDLVDVDSASTRQSTGGAS